MRPTRATVRRIRLPLIVPIAALVVLATAGVFAVEERSLRTQGRQELRDRAVVVERGAIRQLDDFRRSHETYAHLLADTPGLTRAVDAGDGRASRRLLAPLQANEAFEELTVYQEDGTELLHLGPPKGDRVDASLFASGVEGLTRSRAVVDPAGLVVVASTPLATNGRVVGVLVVASTLDGRELDALTRLEGAQLALFQGDSLVTSSVDRPELLRVLDDSSPEDLARLNRRLAPFDLYATERDLDGGCLLALASSADLKAFADQRRLVLFGAGALLLLALAFIVALVSRTVNRPLKRMAGVAGGMASGDYTGRVAPSRIPELDALATAVNHLAEQAEGRALVEEQLRQSQKMEAVGRLAGGVAHDFNNLLTAIIGRSEFLLDKLAGDTRLRSDVEEILEAGNRAASLTRQLLAFSRKQVLEPKTLSPNCIVAESEKLLRRLIGEDVELKCVLDPEAGRVRADAGQLHQAILNLVVNARDAMPYGGSLTITTWGAELGAEEIRQRRLGIPPGEYVALEVADTGVGMDVETQSRIFEPFFTTKEPGKGTGLGLATVHGIVEQSCGFIRVRSEPGRGTAFTIYLPRVEAPAQGETRAGANGKAVGGSETVLLVEDEAIVRSLVSEMLARCGYSVLEAAEPLEAIRICEESAEPIRLMITDVVMPTMSGSALVERVAPLKPEMKVLFISGYTDDAVVRNGVMQSEGNFLQKPFTMDELADRTRRLLDAA